MNYIAFMDAYFIASVSAISWKASGTPFIFRFKPVNIWEGTIAFMEVPFSFNKRQKPYISDMHLFLNIKNKMQ